jgi:hypothetical protein
MATYKVTWKIDVEADCPTDAARLARAYQVDPDTTATIFDVRKAHAKTVRVDLDSDEA